MGKPRGRRAVARRPLAGARIWWCAISRRVAIRLGTDLDETVTLLDGQRHGVETDGGPYQFDNMFDRPRQNIHLIDVRTGARRKVTAACWRPGVENRSGALDRGC